MFNIHSAPLGLVFNAIKNNGMDSTMLATNKITKFNLHDKSAQTGGGEKIDKNRSMTYTCKTSFNNTSYSIEHNCKENGSGKANDSISYTFMYIE